MSKDFTQRRKLNISPHSHIFRIEIVKSKHQKLNAHNWYIPLVFGSIWGALPDAEDPGLSVLFSYSNDPKFGWKNVPVKVWFYSGVD